MHLAAFTGDWTIDRRIEDRRAGATGRFEGTARFQAATEGLDYCETGLLRLGDAPPLTATRSYCWREGDGDMIEVWFEDGRFFHRFFVDEGQATAEHDCPPDRYAVRYDFSSWPRWQAEWSVRGPRKDYVTWSDYRPAGQGVGIGA